MKTRPGMTLSSSPRGAEAPHDPRSGRDRALRWNFLLRRAGRTGFRWGRAFVIIGRGMWACDAATGSGQAGSVEITPGGIQEPGVVRIERKHA